MKSYSHRRDSNDKQWQEAKKLVSERDRGICRLLRILTIPEAMKLKKSAGSYLNIIDPAHYRAVSERPDLCYDYNNIVCLNRYSHSNLDDGKDPLDGHSITSEEVEGWWQRILKGDKKQYEYLMTHEMLKEKNDGISDN